jgi:hypothetical protein
MGPVGSIGVNALPVLLARTEDELTFVDAVELPAYFPLMRPDCKRFDTWVDEVGLDALPSSVSPALLADGAAALSKRERERIVAWIPECMPLIWRRLLRSVDEPTLVSAFLTGAVTAGLAERLPLERESLEVLEADDDGPVETLALAVDPHDLWSPAEVILVDAALAFLDTIEDDKVWEHTYAVVLRNETRFVTTPEHRRRLVRLVGYVRGQLPIPGFPAASRRLEEACGVFSSGRAVRSRLAERLMDELL